MQKFLVILLIFLLPISISLFGIRTLEANDDPCQSLNDMYCIRCHNSERICDSLGKKDEAAWQETIRVMGEYGDIDQATQDQMLICVGKMEKGESSVCKK